VQLAYSVNGPQFSPDTDFWAEFDLVRYGWVDVENGVHLPEQFVASFLINGVRLVEMKIVIVNGKPECRSIKITVKDGEPPLSGPQLRVPIDKYVTHACQAIAVMESAKSQWRTEAYHTEAGTAIKKVRQKRPMTDELLQQVAAIHQATPRGGQTKAIMEGLYVADSTARLYVSEARKRGFLPPANRRKGTS
jgi:hypothetical protein